MNSPISQYDALLAVALERLCFPNASLRAVFNMKSHCLHVNPMGRGGHNKDVDVLPRMHQEN